MTLTLDLPPDLEARLNAEAARLTTPAEIVAYWERYGLIGTRPDITDSLEDARQLRRKAERRDRSE